MLQDYMDARDPQGLEPLGSGREDTMMEEPGMLDQGMSSPAGLNLPEVNPSPEPSINFDVQKNPQDMQAMTDSMMYAPMLKGMDEEQRREKWPGIVEKLGQVSPKMKVALDPSIPPSDKDLDAVLGKMKGKGQEAVLSEPEMSSAEKVPSDLDVQNMSDDELIANATNIAQQGAGSQAGMFDSDVEVDPKLQGAPKGYMWIDPKDKTKGLTSLIKKEKTPEQAGKIMMMESAKALLPTIKNLLFDENGKVNWDTVKKSNIPIIGGSVPWAKDAKRLAQAYEVAIQGITRSETGAAMPAAEVDNTRARYQCNAWDTEDSCVQKFLSLKLFTNGYLDLVKKGSDGKGHFDSSKANAYDAQLQINVQNYKKDWMKRAMKANPNAAPSQLQQLFNKKLLSDPKFLKEMGNQLKKSGK